MLRFQLLAAAQKDSGDSAGTEMWDIKLLEQIQLVRVQMKKKKYSNNWRNCASESNLFLLIIVLYWRSLYKFNKAF